MSYRRQQPIDEQSWQILHPSVLPSLPLLPPIQGSPNVLQAVHGFRVDPKVATKTFACPFSKRNACEPASIWCRPMRTEDWTKVSGIVEHICSRHHPPIQESTWDPLVPSRPERYLSSVKSVIEFNPPYIPDTIPLINGQQWKRIRSLSFWGTQTSKWYEIWAILFPTCPRPTSPFLNDENDGDHRSETLSLGAAPRETPTDSGYASAPALFDLKTSDLNFEKPDSNDEAEDDAQTIYSTVTTIIPSTARESILHVCDAIRDQILPSLNFHDFKADSPWIPWIIKAFAIDLGLESSGSGAANLGIMHFVHKHHEQISTQLRRIFHSPDTDNEASSRNHERSGMSLVDKMSLWGRKFEEEKEEAGLEEHDLFVGVEEYEEDGDQPSHLPSAFSKEILRSRAYTALIGRILRELSLHHADAEHIPGTQLIRETILRQLPTGTISRSRPPQTYTVVFNLPWVAHGATFKSTRPGPTFRVSSGEDIGQRIVLVLSASDRIQATTVRQYLKQTWPLDAAEVLRILNETLGADTEPRPKPASSEITSLQKTETTTTFSEAGLVMKVSGPPHFIAERGEMLGWLVAAVQSGSLSGWAFSTSQEPLPADINSTLVGRFQKYGTSQGVPVAAVKGYPTKYRPDDFPGIEVSPQLFAGVIWSALSGSMKSIGNDPRSFPPALKLLRKKGAMMFWHAPLSTPACRCPRQLETALDTRYWPHKAPQYLQEYRHIISVCPSDTGFDSSIMDRGNSPSTELQQSQEDGETILMDTPVENSKVPAPPATTNSITAGNSLDSEAFSISDSSTDFLSQYLAPDNPLNSIIDSITDRILSDYQENKGRFLMSRTASYTAHGGNDNGSDRRTSAPKLAHLLVYDRYQRPGAKRPMEEQGEEDTDEEDEQRRQKKRQKRAGPEEISSRKLLACPFWKLDPREHKACFRMKLDKISRVKQHLTRKHLPAFYCERCMLVLQSEEAHRAHLEGEMTCSFQSERFTGITYRQQRELSKKSNPSLSEPDQWFAIWGIVFPNNPRPASAYMDPDLSEDLCRFREYAELHGPLFIAAEIRSSQAEGTQPLLEGHSEVALQQAISRGLNRIFENWLGDRPRNNSQATILSVQMPSSSLGQDNSEANHTFQQRGSMSSYPDSGVAMQGGSQRSGRDRDQQQPRDQPPATSWPASFHNYSLAGVGGVGAADGSGGGDSDDPTPPIPITITEDQGPLSPRANIEPVGQLTAGLPDFMWEDYTLLNDSCLFPCGSGLT
ncbi:hypothetical protein QBC43DRAFT_272298 [Cladorrhinum sp. PSN259]|nr:hypothetical protein QBC43DRAFT_272298 [Cladorrhinum sp. PSN259]